MKGKNKKDSLEKFFQRVLKDYEEDPGINFWERVAPNIPSKPINKTFIEYKGWMLVAAFFTGIMLTSLFFFWQSKAEKINILQEGLIVKTHIISNQSEKIHELNQKIASLEFEKRSSKKQIDKQEKIILAYSSKSKVKGETPKKANTSNSNPTPKESLIKLEIARNTGVAAKTSLLKKDWLPLLFLNEQKQAFNRFSPDIQKLNTNTLLFDNQLISHTFFHPNLTIENSSINGKKTPIKINEFSFLAGRKTNKIGYISKAFDITEAESKRMKELGPKKMIFSVGDDALTSFLSLSINPFSGLKYNLEGYKPQTQGLAIVETAGIISSWNWSVFAGIEAKSKWSVQVGLDYNKLTIVKESINNVRFNKEDAIKISEGYLYSFNQRFDGALGQIIANSTIFNHVKNDGQDIEDGDLFKLSISTEQPVQIVRLPILGGYRFDIAPRFYITPKIGVSAVWKTKEQTQLRASHTYSERLNIHNSDIFLTNNLTTESLEANFRTEFGFRWRPRWYLFAEPRLKYSSKALFNYKNLELRDSPLHIMFGLRFNVD